MTHAPGPSSDALPWTSALSVNEFAAVTSLGFEPVGQVMGTTVDRFGYQNWGDCGLNYQSRYRYRRSYGPNRLLPGGVAGIGETRSFGVGYPALVRALYQARRRAMTRMAQECIALGGDGVVGADLQISPFFGARDTFEYRMSGTAVRAQGRQHVLTPFLTHLPGQDLVKLMDAGWMACGLVFGVAVGIRHDDYRTRRVRRSWRSGELDGYTDLVHKVRAEVRKELARDVASFGAQDVVVKPMTMRVWEQECRNMDGIGDHVAEVTMFGTAITRFGSTPAIATPALQVMRLDQRHGSVLAARLTDKEREFS